MSEKGLYFIALIPPKELYEKLWTFKLEIAQNFDSKAALKSPPHITLHMPFKLAEKKKGKLVTALTRFFSCYKSFTITLQGFGAFPPKVIYVEVEPNNTLSTLQKDLGRMMVRQMSIHNLNYQDRPFQPHITIAFRDLKKIQFERAWRYYRHQEFRASCHIDQITLLKHNTFKWEPEVELALSPSHQ